MQFQFVRRYPREFQVGGRSQFYFLEVSCQAPIDTDSGMSINMTTVDAAVDEVGSSSQQNFLTEVDCLRYLMHHLVPRLSELNQLTLKRTWGQAWSLDRKGPVVHSLEQLVYFPELKGHYWTQIKSLKNLEAKGYQVLELNEDSLDSDLKKGLDATLRAHGWLSISLRSALTDEGYFSGDRL